MIRDITLGQYYNTSSLLHTLDPRVKLMGTLVFFVSLFLATNIISYIVITIFLVSIILLSNVPFSFMIRGLKSLLILLIISVVFNLILTPGNAIFSFWFIHITDSGLSLAVRMAIRLIYLVIGSSILTLTTTPSKLTDGLEKGLDFLNIIKVPVAEIALMMSIALRFIPILIEETDKIMKAQMSRGADFDTGNLIEKAKSLIPLLIPLFISAFRRANDLALAMEARCFSDSKNRTKLKPLFYTKIDIMAYISLVIYLFLIILVRYVRI